MTVGEMVERIARTLYSEDPEAWDDGIRIVDGTFGGSGYMQQHPELQARYKADMDEARNKARAAIAAMREPTEAMLATEGVHASCYMCGGHLEGWHAMCDAAISEQSPAKTQYCVVCDKDVTGPCSKPNCRMRGLSEPTPR